VAATYKPGVAGAVAATPGNLTKRGTAGGPLSSRTDMDEGAGPELSYNGGGGSGVYANGSSGSNGAVMPASSSSFAASPTGQQARGVGAGGVVGMAPLPLGNLNVSASVAASARGVGGKPMGGNTDREMSQQHSQTTRDRMQAEKDAERARLEREKAAEKQQQAALQQAQLQMQQMQMQGKTNAAAAGAVTAASVSSPHSSSNRQPYPPSMPSPQAAAAAAAAAQAAAAAGTYASPNHQQQMMMQQQAQLQYQQQQQQQQLLQQQHHQQMALQQAQAQQAQQAQAAAAAAASGASGAVPVRVAPKVKAAMTPAETMRKYGELLTPFEQSEILEYQSIYFVGLSLRDKTKAIPHSPLNNGYDDERGDYKFVLGDHLEYRYEVLSVLGRGSFGQVLKVFDHKKVGRLHHHQRVQGRVAGSGRRGVA
jgi:hypothetical protein